MNNQTEAEEWLDRNALACLVLGGPMNEIIDSNTDVKEGIMIVAGALVKICRDRGIEKMEFSAMCAEMDNAYPETIAEKQRRDQLLEN